MTLLERWRRGRRRKVDVSDRQIEDALREMSDHHLRDIGLERCGPVVSPPDNYPW